MGIITAKFGGSSLADAAHFAKVRDIILADARRCYVVPSAPGKRDSDDVKVTDMLYACAKRASQGKAFDDIFDAIVARYNGIIADLGLRLDLQGTFDAVRARIAAEQTSDYAASRGEYLNGMILAAYLGFPFVDAAEVIRFDEAGNFLSEETNRLCGLKLAGYERAVIPGFYGATQNGRIVTFSRGGSDITGAIVARATEAEVYENWTDVSGFLMADPRIVPEARTIEMVTYNELRELAYMGATVLHEDAIYPVRQANIPIHIRNTNAPQDAGTRIVAHVDETNLGGTITGIAGRKGFVIITLKKVMMHTELGFGRRALSVLEDFGVSFEHIPSGIDTFSMVVDEKYLEGDRLDRIVVALTERCQADAIEISRDIALIATVGHGMVSTQGVAARLFASIAGAHVNIRMIDQGSSEMNIIVGVEAADFEDAVRAIYHAFN
nr:aspartate kinase [Maliibacterium massiliense]